MKLLLALFIVLFTTQVYSEQFTVPDITKSSKIVFTPGISTFYGRCSYNWGGLEVYKFKKFMQGSSSFSYDINPITNYESKIATNKCINIKTNVVDNQVKIPYVNPAAFNQSSIPPVISSTLIVTASTSQVGSIFKMEDDPDSRNMQRISVGIPFTPGYFHCEIVTNSPTRKWLEMAGIRDKIAPGYVLSISSRLYTHVCSKISMTLDPSLLVPPAVTATSPTPNDCRPEVI